MTCLYTRGFEADMKVSTILILISLLFETRMETSQEIIASFYETRFLESENQAVKKGSYNFQTSNTWHKSAHMLESQPLHSAWARRGTDSRTKTCHKPGNKLAFCLSLDRRMGLTVIRKCVDRKQGTSSRPEKLRE